MGNSNTNGQHFFEQLVCCPLVSPTVIHKLIYIDEDDFNIGAVPGVKFQSSRQRNFPLKWPEIFVKIS